MQGVTLCAFFGLTSVQAALLYLPYLNNEILTLFVSPYLKEHGSNYSNMPNIFNDIDSIENTQADLYEQFLIYILFLNFEIKL